MRFLRAESVETADQLPIVVIEGDSLLQASFGDRLATDAPQFLDEPLVFAGQENNAGRGTRVVRQMKEVDIEIGEVPLHHEAEVARRIADGTEEHAVEHLELIPQSHFHRGLNDGADKGP